MSAQQNDLLKLQTTTVETPTNNQNSSEELIQRKHVSGTGFHIITADGHKPFIAFGHYRILEGDTIEELETKIINKDYQILIALMGVTVDVAIKDIQQELKK